MIKLIFMLKRKDGMSREDFRAHYEGSHAELAKKHVGHLIETYARNYIIEISAPPTESGAQITPFQYDVVTEMRLKNQAAVDEMMAIFSSPVVGEIFVEDEHRFLDRKSIVMLTCDEINTGTSV